MVIISRFRNQDVESEPDSTVSTCNLKEMKNSKLRIYFHLFQSSISLSQTFKKIIYHCNRFYFAIESCVNEIHIGKQILYFNKYLTDLLIDISSIKSLVNKFLAS